MPQGDDKGSVFTATAVVLSANLLTAVRPRGIYHAAVGQTELQDLISAPLLAHQEGWCEHCQ